MAAYSAEEYTSVKTDEHSVAKLAPHSRPQSFLIGLTCKDVLLPMFFK